MGFLGGLFNSSHGNMYQAQAAQIDKPATVGQANQLYDQTQQGIAQQQAFLQALQQQGGVQNQTDVFNQLKGVAAGTGPNPAQAMLNQATGANVANQAALMASQRGAGANVGLMARQAAQQGAQTQQQAAGQGATMQAQQALGAMNTMGNIAGQQVGAQQTGLNALNQTVGGARGDVLGAINAQNNAAVQMQSNINNANAGIAGVNAKAQNEMGSGLIKGIASAPQMLMAEGGEVPTQVATGPSSNVGKHFKAAYNTLTSGNPIASGDGIEQSGMETGKALGETAIKGGQAIGSLISDIFSSTPTLGQGAGSIGAQPMAYAKGGKVPVVLSPGEKTLTPKEAEEVAKGKKSLNETGKKVPGKAKVKGDSYANDTYKTELQEGGFVIPRSIMESDNPEQNAAAFVRAHMSRKLALKGK